MWRLAFSQMRASAPRLAAAALTIVLGSAFVATTLLAGAAMTDTTHRAMVASYAEADLVIKAEALSLDDVEELRALPGVQAADPVTNASAEVGSGTRSLWTSMAPAPDDEGLTVATLQEGRFPETAGEVALVADAADRLRVSTGETLTLGWEEIPQEDLAAADSEETAPERTVRIVGLVEPPSSYFVIGPQLFVDTGTFSEWAHEAQATDRPVATEAVALLADGTDPQQARRAMESALPHATVQTVTERAEELTALYTGDETLLTAVGVGFAAVAMAVAALVIANTFTVLVAQRTRTLALLRCVGASARQVRRSVLLEAAVLGLISAAVGLGLSVAVVAGGLRLLSGSADLPLGTDVLLTPQIVLTTLLTGLLVTVGAAIVPARLATRVAPLAALQPVEGTPERRAGRIRVLASAAGVVIGAALLGAAVVIARSGEEMDVALLALAVGVVGGLLALLGVLLGAVFVVPELIRLAGKLTGPGVAARTAVANATRHPRRTAATASALLIGVGLVTLMSTGAATTQAALSRTLDEQFSVDLTMDGAGAALSQSHLDLLHDHPQISQVAVLDAVPARLELANGERFDIQSATIPDGSVDQVVRDAALDDQIAAGTVVLPKVYQQWFGVQDGQEVALVGADGRHNGLRVQLSGIDGVALVAPEVLTGLDSSPEPSIAWAQMADGADELDLLRDLQGALADDPGAGEPLLGGSGVERAAYEQVIDTLLLIVIALLAVSVVIALVGVANTLSLSVLERRRESAMLRALGLTRGQLRATLAIEAVLISGAGAVIGVVIGLVLGWAGSAVLLSGIGEVPLVVPWREVGLVLAVAIVAGLLASVLPARSAVRTSPVEALAGP